MGMRHPVAKAPLVVVVSALFAVGAALGCSSAAPAGKSIGGTSGEGGGGGDGGSGGGGTGGAKPGGSGGGGAGGKDEVSGGAGGSSTPDASVSGGSGGSAGSGGAAGSGGNAGTGGDGGAAGGSGGASGGTGGGAGTGMTGGDVNGWYEAEAIPPNVLSGSTLVVTPPKPRVGHCTACPSTAAIKPGDSCCSGGGEIIWLTQGIGPIPGGLTYNNVMVPSDGMYDVTWWYHCGNNDNFGDKHCGGQTSPPTTPSGCRPHQIVVNGTEMKGTYHFPCFAGSFAVIHAATTALPLKAGANSLKVYPKQRDAADMDALQVQPAGKGIGPLIMSNDAPGAN
jgi:hypothetical protein